MTQLIGSAHPRGDERAVASERKRGELCEVGGGGDADDALGHPGAGAVGALAQRRRHQPPVAALPPVAPRRTVVAAAQAKQLLVCASSPCNQLERDNNALQPLL